MLTQSKWKCYTPFGYTYRPGSDSEVPGWFRRLTARWLIGIKWKVEPQQPIRLFTPKGMQDVYDSDSADKRPERADGDSGGEST